MGVFTNVREEVSFVVVGNLNPAIFNPDWLLRHGLLREEDVTDQVTLDVIHPEVCRFSLPWCSIEVLPNRLSVRSDKKGYFNVVRDLVVGIFSILSHTPITAIGMNMTYWEVCDSQEIIDELGDILTPKQIWNDILPDSPRHGLIILNMQSQRSDDIPGYYSSQIKPIKHEEKPGFELLFNCHFDYEQIGDMTLTDLIQKQWEPSLKIAESVRDSIVKDRKG